jgi:hypothetical protein
MHRERVGASRDRWPCVRLAMSRPSGFEQLSGEEWQELCIRVLHEHHPGPELVEVPDDDRGDAGLEVFSLSGNAYQCYAPEGEPLTASQRYNKQRDKMTADVGKFIDNATKIQALLPARLCISRWVMLVRPGRLPPENSKSSASAARSPGRRSSATTRRPRSSRPPSDTIRP